MECSSLDGYPSECPLVGLHFKVGTRSTFVKLQGFNVKKTKIQPSLLNLALWCLPVFRKPQSQQHTQAIIPAQLRHVAGHRL